MFVGVEVQESRVAAVLMAGATVRHVVEREGGGGERSDDGGLADVLAELVRAEPAAAQARAVTVTRAGPSVVAAPMLAPTACLRLSPTAADTAPPMAGWPAELRAAVGDHVFACAGGHTFDGRHSRGVDPAELDRVARRLRSARIDAAAITSVFSPVNNAHELAAAARLGLGVPGLRVSLSHEIGTIGLFERENATILNASLGALAERTAAATTAQVAEAIPGARVYLAQNDGTAVELSFGRRYPVLGLWSGQACSIHGATVLSGHADCVVLRLDEQGCTVGLAHGGLARQTPYDTEAAGVPVSLRRAETVSVAAPEDGAAVERAVRAVDPGRSLPVVLVGPAVRRVPDRFPGIRPPYAAVAAAVGAARTWVGGVVDRIVSGDAIARAVATREAESLARARAVLAGAVDSSVRIVEAEELPVGYLPGDVVRLRVQAIGALD